jgi:hypothetical protein
VTLREGLALPACGEIAAGNRVPKIAVDDEGALVRVTCSGKLVRFMSAQLVIMERPAPMRCRGLRCELVKTNNAEP